MEEKLAEVLQYCLKGRKVAVWGTGFSTDKLINTINKHCDVDCFISRDAKPDKQYHQKPVYAPEFLGGGGYYVIVLAGAAYPEIRKKLRSYGFRKEYDYFDWWCGNPSVFAIDRVFKGVSVGRYTPIRFVDFGCIKSIGRYTSIHNSFICKPNHTLEMLSTSHEFLGEEMFDSYWLQEWKQKVIFETGWPGANVKVSIGNDVWIGANVFVNASTVTQIGDGAVIGAGSVVTHDLPPYAIAYGMPARIKRYRYSPEEIEILLRVKWWEWEDEQIRENAELFVYPEKFFEKFSGGNQGTTGQ
jgi:aminocyclitol acetyltransferase